MTVRKRMTAAALIAVSLLGSMSIAPAVSAQSNPSVVSYRMCQQSLRDQAEFLDMYNQTFIWDYMSLYLFANRWWNTNCNF